MWRMQFLLSLRQLLKHKGTSLIKLSGLVLGMSAFVLMWEYVAFERGFNQMFPKVAQTYRLFSMDNSDGYLIAPGHAPALAEQYPQIENYTVIIQGIGNGVFATLDKKVVSRQQNTAFVSHTFLDLFDVQLKNGLLDLSRPKTLALSSKMAEKYFGKQDAVGQQLQIDNQFGQTFYEVVAVYKEMPENSDFRYDILLSHATLAVPELRANNAWADPLQFDFNNSFVFFELAEGSQVSELEAQFAQWSSTAPPDAKKDLKLQALSNLHLGRSLSEPYPTFGDRSWVLFLTIAAFLLLAIAWVNYINLSTAQASERAREVGIHKVLGAERRQLVSQYLAETTILTGLATFLALTLIPLLQPLFNDLVDLPLSLEVFAGTHYPFWGILISILGAVFSGGYVALVLTRFKPIKILQGRFKMSRRSLWLRKGLVIGQFTIAIAFIASTFILFQQLKYIQNKDLGVALEQRIAIRGPFVKGEDHAGQQQSFRDEVEKLSFVNSFSGSASVPGNYYNFSSSKIRRLVDDPNENSDGYGFIFIDENYFDSYEIELIAGRGFSAKEALSGWEARKVVLNEKAREQLGFHTNEAAIGALVDHFEEEREIIGVVQNYHQLSLRHEVGAMVFLPSRNSGFFTVKMSGEDMASKITALEGIYQKVFPGNPFQYEFLDENFGRLYAAEQRSGRLFFAAASLTILISALGLLGLVAFVARQRTKEIGIRKILGASVSQIVNLLFQGFLPLIVIAILISVPIAWWLMSEWLQNFAYQVDIKWWFFALSGLLAIVIAFITVSIQSLQVALANPIESLRNE
ncbi:MAG: FtsX-like permease family protein [Bacteroidota bacterium]